MARPETIERAHAYHRRIEAGETVRQIASAEGLTHQTIYAVMIKAGIHRPAADAEARRVNATRWEPLPGMRKRRCVACWYWFAAPAGGRNVLYCPDCLLPAKVRQREHPGHTD